MPAGMNTSDEYELEIHYESKLLQAFNETSFGRSGVIKDQSDWDRLIVKFVEYKLISLENSDKLEQYKPSFPLTFQTLLSTITQVFGDSHIKSLNSNMFVCTEQLENCRTYINMLNIRSLRAEELHQLANILYTCKIKAQETEKALGQVVGKVKGLSEDSQAFVFDQLDPVHDSISVIQLPHHTF